LPLGRERVPQGRLNPPCAHRGLVVKLHNGFDMGLVPYLPVIEKFLVRDLSSDLLDHTFHLWKATSTETLSRYLWLLGGRKRRPFHHTPTRGPRRFRLLRQASTFFEPPCAGWFLTFSPPLPPPPLLDRDLFWPLDKGPILVPRPLNPKWSSLDLLYVMARGICGTLSLSIHRPRFRFLT
jgi:hypothetical protein